MIVCRSQDFNFKLEQHINSESADKQKIHKIRICQSEMLLCEQNKRKIRKYSRRKII